VNDPPDASAQSFTAMSLRDYFAAQALNGLVSRLPELTNVQVLQTVARDAYAFADAMLEARAEHGEAEPA